MHISDLHLGSFSGHEEQLEQTIRAINAAKPDIVCFTGDLYIGKIQEYLKDKPEDK